MPISGHNHADSGIDFLYVCFDPVDLNSFIIYNYYSILRSENIFHTCGLYYSVSAYNEWLYTIF